jgi:hypothetical protein
MKFYFILLFYVVGLSNSDPSSGFVYSQDGQLCLEGKPFHFIGVNRYDLCGEDGTSLSWPEEDLDWFFNQVSGMGITGLRFWVFKSTSFTLIDRVLDRADNYSIKCVLTLSDQWGSCPWTNGFGYKYSDFYETGYLEGYEISEGGCAPPYYPTYYEWVTEVVSRYANNTAVLMWQMMNEGECEFRNNTGVCDFSAFYNWAVNVSSLIRSLDENHLINIGTSGTGQCGARNEEYEIIYSIPTVDILEAHDYGYPTLPLPNGQNQNTSFGGGLFLQDHNWGWFGVGSSNSAVRGNWTSWFEGTIPQSAVTPFNRFGFSFWSGGWETVGTIYIDLVQIGPITYSFENGTEGWSFDGCVTNVSSTSSFSFDGSYSLAIDLNCNQSEGGGIYVTISSFSISPGDFTSLVMYVPLDFPPNPTISTDLLQTSPKIRKPFFLGECGIMSNCNTTDCYSRSERAALMQAKIDAIFNGGGFGFLIWSYCYWNGPLAVWDFNTEDPLYQVVKNKAEQLYLQDSQSICGSTSTSSTSSTFTTSSIATKSSSYNNFIILIISIYLFIYI